MTGLLELRCGLSYEAEFFWRATIKKNAASTRRLEVLACLLADWLVLCECNRPMIFSVGLLEDSFPTPLWSGPSFVNGEPRVLSDVCLIRRCYGGQAGRCCYDVLPHHPRSEGKKEGKKNNPFRDLLGAKKNKKIIVSITADRASWEISPILTGCYCFFRPSRDHAKLPRTFTAFKLLL